MTSWADHAKEQLRTGNPVEIHPKGNSMLPLVKSGDLVRLEPVTDPTKLQVNDIVLVRVHGRDYLHLIKAVGKGPTFLIGNNRGHDNGWVGSNCIYGRRVP